jgi:hypothetical protein
MPRGDRVSVEMAGYFGGAGGVKISRFRPGSGFGFGFGAFFTSFLPLSLLPMQASMTQLAACEKPQTFRPIVPRISRGDAST